LQTLSKAQKNISKPADLVDDFLRRKCLKCHLESKTINPTQNICLSCHNQHVSKEDAKSAKPTMDKCLKCHNNEFIGTDYLGLFPHDYDEAYRSPLTQEGYYPPKPYGIDYHHLSEDIHYTKGMSCVDCHNKKIGKGGWEKVECNSCHQNPTPQNHKNYHDNLSCNSCHSSWNVSSYEMNVLRDDTANYKQWERLIVQDDLYLEKFLKKALDAKIPPKPVMKDNLSGKLENGIWYSGWLFRRWENIFLVNSDDGKIKIAKPMFQYRISYKDKKNKMILDDVSKIDNEKIEAFIPKAPHTITQKSKSCEMCHENKIMLDKNLINKDILKGKVIKGSLFTKEQIGKLSSDFYKKERSKELFSQSLNR
jgi:predicted CXXCH cytochrome family protein